MTRFYKTTLWTAAGMICPFLSHAQSGGVADDIKGLQGVLDQLYSSMLPQCSQLIGVGQGIAGFAALWYIGVRVWRHMARAEAVDVFPLLRPFAIGLAILLFPSVIALMNGVLQPVVTGTSLMESNANAAITTLLQQKELALKGSVNYQMFVGPDGNGNESLWEKYSGEAVPSSGLFSGITNSMRFTLAKSYYNYKNSIKEWMAEVLQVLYEAAALCINTLRTFNLLVLAIMGPLVLGLSVFDGFQYTLRAWLARYINVFLWLPVASIFGSIIANIQAQMLQLDLNQIQATGATWFSNTDTAYLIFLIISIIGYLTVPSMANLIMEAGGAGAHTLKVSNFFRSPTFKK